MKTADGAWSRSELTLRLTKQRAANLRAIATRLPGLIGFLWFWGRLLWFAAPGEAVLRERPDVAWAYAWMRFLQLDLLAQGVGMLNASDYLNPHLWTVVAMVLACKVFIIRATRTAPAAAAPGPALAIPRLAV